MLCDGFFQRSSKVERFESRVHGHESSALGKDIPQEDEAGLEDCRGWLAILSDHHPSIWEWNAKVPVCTGAEVDKKYRQLERIPW